MIRYLRYGLIIITVTGLISAMACQSQEKSPAEPAAAEAKPEITQAELTAAVPELNELHEVVYPLWHDAFPEKDYTLIKELLPQAEELTAKLDAAELPGILRDKQAAWDAGKAALKNSLKKLQEAADADDQEEMLAQTEAFHAHFERLMRTIRPMVKELDAFHQEMYKLYHYYAPEFDLANIRTTVAAMQEKLPALKQVELPKRLADRREAFAAAVAELETAVDELAEIVKSEDKDPILKAVEKVHDAYQKAEHIFD